MRLPNSISPQCALSHNFGGYDIFRPISSEISHLDFPLSERTQSLLDLSDEIAAINMRMAGRPTGGSAEDIADRERLEVLIKQLEEWDPSDFDPDETGAA